MSKLKKSYSNESINEAVVNIRPKKICLRNDSKELNRPLTNLQYKFPEIKPYGYETKHKSKILSEEEETELVDLLMNLVKFGFPLNPDDVLDEVHSIILKEGRVSRFKYDRPGKHWYHCFLKRHPQLDLKTPTNPISNGQWYQNLKSYLISQKAEDILTDPKRMFLYDETVFSMSPQTWLIKGPQNGPNVIMKRPYKDTLSVSLILNGSGLMLPPMLSIPYVTLPPYICNNMPEDWLVGTTKTGLMRAEAFYEYIANSLNDWLTIYNIARPVLFLIENPKNRISWQLISFCEAHGIILYAKQPADVDISKCIKSDFEKSANEWKKLPRNRGEEVTKFTFCDFLVHTLDFKNKNDIENAFKVCGLLSSNQKTVGKKVKEDSYITDKEFDIAQKVILALKNKLIKKNIDYKLFLKIIKEEQLKNKRRNTSY